MRTVRGRAWWLVPSGAALALAVPVLTWWLAGFGERTAYDPERDYMYRAPRWVATAAPAAGAAALVAAALCAATLSWATRTGRMDSRWWVVIGAVAGAGTLAVTTYAAATAGVIGANIGGGLMLLGGPPLAGLLLVYAAVAAVVLTRRRPRGHAPARQPDAPPDD